MTECTKHLIPKVQFDDNTWITCPICREERIAFVRNLSDQDAEAIGALFLSDPILSLNMEIPKASYWLYCRIAHKTPHGKQRQKNRTANARAIRTAQNESNSPSNPLPGPHKPDHRLAG
jgi:hypothetical protein